MGTGLNTERREARCSPERPQPFCDDIVHGAIQPPRAAARRSGAPFCGSLDRGGGLWSRRHLALPHASLGCPARPPGAQTADQQPAAALAHHEPAALVTRAH